LRLGADVQRYKDGFGCVCPVIGEVDQAAERSGTERTGQGAWAMTS